MLMMPVAAANEAGVHDALRDQLVTLLPPKVRITAHGWRPWASASFIGARHWFDLAGSSQPMESLASDGWQSREWPLSGSFVADVAVLPAEPGKGRCRVEMLTVAD